MTPAFSQFSRLAIPSFSMTGVQLVPAGDERRRRVMGNRRDQKKREGKIKGTAPCAALLIVCTHVSASHGTRAEGRGRHHR